MNKEKMLPYYTMILCGGLAFVLAFSSLVNGKELQAIFFLVFAVLCAQIAIFFKLAEIDSAIKKGKK